MPQTIYRAAVQGRTLIAVILLLLIYWATRLSHLLHFPLFIDEVVHIEWARELYAGSPLIGAANGKLFGLWWMAAMGLDGPAVAFVVRAATILFQMITLAGLFHLGRIFAGAWAGLLAMSFYIMAPYGLFYDRLALVDSYVASFGVMCAVFAVLAVIRFRPAMAILAGLMLAGAILAKASGVMLWIVPLLAYMLLGRQSWRERLQLAAWTYGTTLAFWGPFFLLLQWRGYNYFSTATSVVGAGVDDNLFGRLWFNLISAEGILGIDVIYFSLPLLLLTMTTTLFLLCKHWRRALFLVGIMALPLGGLLAFADKLSPRYFHFHVPFALLLLAVGIMMLALWLMQRIRLPIATLPLTVIGVWALSFTIPFHQQYFDDVTGLTLPRLDHLEYLESDASGFGLAEAAQYLQRSAETPIHVIGLLPNCAALQIYLAADPAIIVECPQLSLDGSSQGRIDSRIQVLADGLNANTQLWLAYETTAFTSVDSIGVTLSDEQIFDRPGGRTSIRLWRVERETKGD